MLVAALTVRVSVQLHTRSVDVVSTVWFVYPKSFYLRRPLAMLGSGIRPFVNLVELVRPCIF